MELLVKPTKENNAKSFKTKTQIAEDHKNVESFYELVTKDYQYWDTQNMHFGYAKSWKDSFSLSKMLQQMNDKVLNQFENIFNPHLADLGCGTGGTMQYAAKKFLNVHISGFTISKYQREIGNKKLQNLNCYNTLYHANYEDLPVPENTFDGAYAIESLCHSGSSEKALREAHRILKKGGKLVIADAYLKREKLSVPALWVKGKIEKNWELDELISIQKLRARLEKSGFNNIEITEMTWKVAPSVLYVFRTIIKFYISNFFHIHTLSKASHNNAWASFYTFLTAPFIKSFGYFQVIAEK